MSAFFELKELTIQGVVSRLNLSLEPGMVVLCRTAGEQESKQLAQAVIGERQPDTGAVLLDGLPLHELNQEQLLLIRSNIGIVAPQAGLISNLKMWENITLPLLYHHGALSPELEQKGLQLIEKLGYTGSIWALPGHLGYAERIMTAFVRAVLAAPRLMVYAECLDDLPPQPRERLLEQAIALQQQDTPPAALFITTGESHLPSLKPDIVCDVRQTPPQITRQI